MQYVDKSGSVVADYLVGYFMDPISQGYILILIGEAIGPIKKSSDRRDLLPVSSPPWVLFTDKDGDSRMGSWDEDKSYNLHVKGSYEDSFNVDIRYFCKPKDISCNSPKPEESLPSN